MAKTLTLVGPPHLQTMLCAALRQYAEAAYPPGCSECGQVARAALMDAADKLESGFAATGSKAEVSRRLRAHMKAAVEYFCEQQGEAGLRACLDKFVSGEVISEQLLEMGCAD